MLKVLMRLLGYGFVAGGFVALVIDGARAIAHAAIRFTPLAETLLALLGERYRLLQPAIEHNLHPLLWDPVMLTLTRAPTALVALAIGFLLLWLGAPPRETIGIVTRR